MRAPAPSRRGLLLGAAALTVALSAPLPAYAFDPETSAEAKSRIASDRFIQRLKTTTGATFNARDFKSRFGQVIRTSVPRGARFLRGLGRWAGPAGIALALGSEVISHVISADGDGKVEITERLGGGAMPGSYVTINDALNHGQQITYSNGRSFWKTIETAQRASTYYGSSWTRQYVNSRADGYHHLWETQPQGSTPVFYVVPTKTFEQLQDQLDALATKPVANQGLVQIFNAVLQEMHRLWPGLVPDPAIRPFIAEDLGPWVLGDLTAPGPLDRDFSLTVPETGTDPGTETPPGGTTGGDGTIELEDMDDPLFPDLPGLDLPDVSIPTYQAGGVGSCPVFEVPWRGQPVRIDRHCTLAEQVRPSIAPIIRSFYLAMAATILFRS